MSSQPGYQRGDRVALVATDDPDTRLHPGDQGTVTRWDPAQGQLHIRWDSGSSLTMLPGKGDQVRLLAAAAAGDDDTGPEDPARGQGRRTRLRRRAGSRHLGLRRQRP